MHKQLVPEVRYLAHLPHFWSYLGLGLLLLLTSGNGRSLRADESSDLAAAASRVTYDLTYLASDELAGRGVGTPGIASAGEFIAKRFQDLGFKTDSFDGTPFQNFGIPGQMGLGPAEANKLAFTVNAQPFDELKLGKEFTSLTLGNSGSFNAPVVFAGYGITATDLGYDDYAGIQAEGKVVIVLRKEPQQDDDKSIFDGRNNSQYAFFTIKENNAAVHKVAALIVVNDAKTVETMLAKMQDDLARASKLLEELNAVGKPTDPKELEQLETRQRIAQQTVESLQAKVASGTETAMAVDAAGTAITKQAVPTFYCTRAVADKLIQAGSGQSLADLEKAIDRDAKPHSVELKDVQATGQADVKVNETAVRNVIAVMPGEGALADEYVVVGAHYDHVGMGGMGSLAPGTIEVHNGADDNASGTVTMLEVARQISTLKTPNRRSVIFMAFTGEESGLLGSQHYVRNPRWPLEKTVAMINLDMVGRLLNDELTVYGTGTALEFPTMIDRLNEPFKFRLVKVPQGRGASDHQSFYDSRIPVFHLFTGLHNEYHRPSDDVGLINVSGVVRISQLVTSIAREIAETPERPKLLEIKGSAAPRSQSGAARAMLGIRLDRGPEMVPKVIGLTDGGPAETAGLMVGDIIVSINGTKIANIGEFRNEMSKLKAGQQVPIAFQREGNPQTVDVKLGE